MHLGVFTMEEKEIREIAKTRVKDKLQERLSYLEKELNELEIEREIIEIRETFMYNSNYYLEQGGYFNPESVMANNLERIQGKYEELVKDSNNKIKNIKDEIKAVNRTLDSFAYL